MRGPGPYSDSLELIGVRFDGSARAVGQAGAPPTLREAGLSRALPAARMAADVTVSHRDPERGSLAGFYNERAVLEMVAAVNERVRAALQAGRFPVLYGGDCAVLLGAVPAVSEACGSAGLVSVDAHEDATTPEQSTTGEVANMEIALLLGMGASRPPEPLRDWLPAVHSDALVLLGQRDAEYRREIGVASIAGRVRVHPAGELADDPERIAAAAAAQVRDRAASWWLHVDLDVLDAEEFRACGAASDPAMPPGLTWLQLTAITRAALATDGCRGWSLGVFNADLDPDGRDARRVVAYLAAALQRSSG